VHLTLILAALLSRPFDFRGSADDPHVLAALRNLAIDPAYQLHDVEVAAFLVRDADGRISCLLWPGSRETRTASYRGDRPVGVVAMAHTHPSFTPEPSKIDIDETKRVGLPMYVVSTRDIYVIDPSSGESLRLIRQRNWTYPTATRCECKTEWVNRTQPETR